MCKTYNIYSLQMMDLSLPCFITGGAKIRFWNPSDIVDTSIGARMRQIHHQESVTCLCELLFLLWICGLCLEDVQ